MLVPIGNHMTKALETSPDQLIVIPFAELSAEALRGIMEAFVLQEGTDYGAQEYSLDQKVAAVARQLERGEAEIVYDIVGESSGIRLKSQC